MRFHSCCCPRLRHVCPKNRHQWVCSSVAASLLLGGLLLQQLWLGTLQSRVPSQETTHPGSRYTQSIPLFGAVKRESIDGAVTAAAGGCKNFTSIRDCSIGYHDWSFEPPTRLTTVCSQNATKILLVFVPVAPNMLAERTTVRQTWGSGFEHLTFLVLLRAGQPADADLIEEATKFGDVFTMRGPVDDSYRCLTLKVLAFMRWHSANCLPNFRYLLKSDHDSYWHAASLMRLLRSRLGLPSGGQNVSSQSADGMSPHSPPEILGGIQVDAPVRREPGSKFCTPVEAYGPPSYPAYAVGGPGYLMSREAASGLVAVAAAPSAPAPFWLEDVYVTGMLAAAANATGRDRRLIRHVHSPDIHCAPYVWLNWTVALAQPPLGVHGLTESQMRLLHSFMQSPGADERAKVLHEFQP